MNEFNKVFLVVKKQCESQKLLAELNSLEIIAQEAKIPLHKLPVYLDHLQDSGLIKYSISENYIHLTSFGKKQDSLIKKEK